MEQSSLVDTNDNISVGNTFGGWISSIVQSAKQTVNNVMLFN